MSISIKPKMKQLTLFLLFHHALAQYDSNFFDQEKCVIDYRSLENMWENKLRHDLKKCFVRHKPPAQNGTEPLIVNLQFFMKSFKYDSEFQEFSATTWTSMVWEDKRLQWDPKKYEDIDKLIMTTRSGIWFPGIRLINGIEDDFDFRYLYVSYEVEHDGLISCVLQITFKVKCIADLREWPYDAQYCKMEFGAYPETATKVQFDIGMNAMLATENGGEWIMKDIEQILDETSEKQVILKFRLERYAEGLAAIVIYPALMLSVLTVSTLFLDVRQSHRLLVSCFSLLSQFYLLKDVSWEFPENVKDPPNLLLYYRGSFILTILLIVEHLVLNSICKKDVVCYNWVSSINVFVATRVKLIWPRWETKTVNVKDWTNFANIVNIVSIFVTVVVYVSLYCAFMPHPNSFDSD